MQEQPLKCSYINGPCPHMGTPACAEKATITCRNIRQKNEAKEETCSSLSKES